MTRPTVLRGRYAPSPTGDLHLGNASTALLAWWSIRARDGLFTMRVEDLDRNRSKPEWQAGQLEDLLWLGIDWDEGPDVGGPYPPYLQSQRDDRYEAALSRLQEMGRLYPCFCSRKEIAAASSAPQEPGDERPYPGTCSTLAPAEVAKRLERGDPHALRLRAVGLPGPAFRDLVRGEQPATTHDDDFVVRRRDGTAAYQLAVTVDDRQMQVNEVVRGDDLLSSSYKQRLLFDLFGWEAPVYGHVPLLLGEDGARLSKRHQGITLKELRQAGLTGPDLVGRIAGWLGLSPNSAPRPAVEFVKGFDLSQLPRADRGIRVLTGGTEGDGVI